MVVAVPRVCARQSQTDDYAVQPPVALPGVPSDLAQGNPFLQFESIGNLEMMARPLDLFRLRQLSGQK
jgi:hypothetical protein